MTDELSEKEVSYLKEIRKYERKWVAVLETEDEDMIVGSGEDAVEAKKSALENGFNDVVVFWVRPFNAGFIP